MEWTQNIINSAHKIQRKAYELEWKHKKMAEMQDNYEGYIYLVSIILTGLVGAINVINLIIGSSDSDDGSSSTSQRNRIISIVNILLMGMVGFVSKIQNSKRFPARAENNRKVANMHSAIAEKINFQLNMHQDRRQNANEFILWTQTDQKQLIENSETIEKNNQ